MAFDEDLSVFFDPTDFANSVALNGVGVDAIFDNGYSPASVGLSGMASADPSLTLPTDNVPINWSGLPVVVNVRGTLVNYVVAVHEPDGTGVSRLILELA